MSLDEILADLELAIGTPSQQGSEVGIIYSQRKDVIAWLNLKGVFTVGPATSNSTLGKMYGIPKYLNSVLNNQNGTSKYKQRPSTPLDFEEEEKEKEVTWSANINPSATASTPTYTPVTLSPTITIQNLKSLVESTFQETLKNNFDQELIKNQEALKNRQENLGKVLKFEIDSKFKNQEEELKKLVEDIIFKSYLKIKIENQNQDLDPIATPLETHNPKVNSHIPKIDPNYYFDPYVTKVTRSALNTSENLFVYGDTGCGKTTHLEQVCAVMGHGIVRINPQDGITREMFLGSMKLINNETIFIPGALPFAMENGLVLLVDEISFLPPNLTAILNPVGEKGGKLYIPETSEWISPSPGFCIFATDNTGGKGDRSGNYTGTEVQNTATLDRFAFCLKMNYLPKEKEFEMLEKRFPNQFVDEINRMIRFAIDIRAAFSRGELAITLSTRKLIKFFDQRENNFTIQEALNNTLISWLDEDDETLVKTMIDRLQLI